MTQKNKLKVLVIHGPNLNMLGKREPEIYGKHTLAGINKDLEKQGKSLGIDVITFQSNYEGAIIEKIHQAFNENYNGIIINLAAYTHTSIGIKDALLMLSIPIIEVHLTNIYKREKFRSKSLISSVVTGQIIGLGYQGYLLALKGIAEMLNTN